MLPLSRISPTPPRTPCNWFPSPSPAELLNSDFPSAMVFPLLLLPYRLFCVLPSRTMASILSLKNAFPFWLGSPLSRKPHQMFSKYRSPSFLGFWQAVSWIWRRKSSFSTLIRSWPGCRRNFAVRLRLRWWRRVRVRRWRGRSRTPWRRTRWTSEGCLFRCRAGWRKEETQIRVRFLTLISIIRNKKKGQKRRERENEQ